MGVESSLPARVNIVCGGRYALAKKGWRDCPVAVVPAHNVLTTARERNSSDNKWLVQIDGQSQDLQGRPVRCIIRNDHHPQRSLRAGDRVMLDEASWTTEHQWLLEYVDTCRTTDAVGAPFRLRSMRNSEKTYLAVDETSGEAAMQSEPPTMLWQFCDSAACTTSVAVSFFGLGKSAPEQAPVPMPPRQLSEYCELEFFNGTLLDAFKVQQRTCDGSRAFTDVDQFLSQGTALCDIVEVASPPATLFGVYLALLGRDSSFRQRLADGIDPVVSPVHRLERFRYCGTATTRQVIQVPVLGRRVYEEEVRIALCTDSGASEALLAIQSSAQLSIGFPVGNFLTESLHMFSQKDGMGPICLRSTGLAQPGRAQQQALDGMMEKQAAFVALVQDVLSAASLDTLQRKAGMGADTCEASFTVPSSVQSSASLSPTGSAARGDSAGSSFITRRFSSFERLPRVNVVCGGRFVLTKKGWGDCPVHVAPASEVMESSSTRRATCNKWIVQVDGESYDDTGRPVQIVVRNDCHPQRSLRAGDPVMLDNTAWTAEHKWRLEYVELQQSSGLWGSPFHLRSLRNYEKTYLTVEEASGKATMRKDPPTMLWQFYDTLADTGNLLTDSLPSIGSILDQEVRLEANEAEEQPEVKGGGGQQPDGTWRLAPAGSCCDWRPVAGVISNWCTCAGGLASCTSEQNWGMQQMTNRAKH